MCNPDKLRWGRDASPLLSQARSDYMTANATGRVQMQDWAFWAAAGAMAVAVMVVLGQALRRGSNPVEPGSETLRVYRDQLAEVDRDLARGTLPADEAARLRSEIGRRLLDADRNSQSAPTPNRGGIVLATTVMLAILAGGIATYDRLGAPGYPDLPLATRLTLAEAAYANRPTQAEAEAAVPPRPAPDLDPEFADLLAKLRAAIVQRPDDQRGLELLARNEAAIGNFAAARTAQTALIAAKGAQASADDHAGLAELLIIAAGGIVTAQAEQSIVAALQKDPANGTARFYSGLMFAQTGRPDRTFNLWASLLADSPPDAPWVAPIRADIEMVAQAAGQRYTLPPLGGPTAADIAAAADMTDADRQAMIQSMVTQLSDRLASEGGPAPDWARLITALATLGQTDQARTILTEARSRFATMPADLAMINQVAADAGLDP